MPKIKEKHQTDKALTQIALLQKKTNSKIRSKAQDLKSRTLSFDDNDLKIRF